MRGPDLRRRALELGVLLVPIAVIKLVAPCIGGGADTAGAAGPIGAHRPASLPEVAEPAWTDAQRAAAEYLHGASPEVTGSPFGHRERDRGPAPVQVEPAEDPMELEVAVSMIMQTPSGGIALVDGRTCRVGSTVSDGLWKITAIDAAGRTVTFENVRNGKTEARSLDR